MQRARMAGTVFVGAVGGIVVLQKAIGATSVALNIWNLVICSRAMKHSEECIAQAFVVGSMVCSALALVGWGIIMPVPQLVIGILGLAWRVQSSNVCGPFTSPSLTVALHRSLIVLWFTFASNALFYIAFFSCLYLGFRSFSPLSNNFFTHEAFNL